MEKKYSLEEIKEMRNTMDKAFIVPGVIFDSQIAVSELLKAPFIIDQLLQEREELKKKVENLINNRFCENHELCEGCCGSHCCDLLDNELLALLKD